MAIPHASPGDVIDVRPLGAALAGARSHALFKSADLEVIRLVLLRGDQMPPHAVPGEITLQCIEGQLDRGFVAAVDDRAQAVAAGRKASEKQAPSPRPCAMKAGTALSTIFSEPQT